jgi:anti-sigma factor RsiW
VSISHETLMRYFDGELSPEQAAELEEQLASDPEAERVLAGLDQIGEVVRGVALARSDAHADLTDRILERVAAEPRVPAARQGALERVSVRPLPQKSRLQRAAPALIGGLALAAAAALLFERVREPVAPPAPIVEVNPPAPAPEIPEERSVPALPEPIAEADTAPAIAIETVDFGAHRGSIFMLQEGEATTPVVWLVDEPGPGKGRMEPL